MSNHNRTKGHDLERQVARDLKPNFKFVKTSRAASKLADDCAIDLVFVPFLIQCKNGYEKARPKYEVEYEKVKSRIEQNFPKDHSIHSLPFILIHKITAERGKGKEEQNTQVTMSYEYFKWLIDNLDIETKNKIPLLSV